MPLTIKNVLDKFDDFIKPELIKVNCNGVGDNNGFYETRYKTKEEIENLLKIKQFLQDNLTLMLESIEKELPKESNLKSVSEYWSGYNAYRQEVINIINSHR